MVLGVVLVLVGFLLKLVAIGFYFYVYQFKLFEFKNTIWVFIGALIACDLVFYIFHRLGHMVSIFWASHVVHHSSEKYNYTVGLRNHFIHVTYRFLFWAPLCWLGFHPLLIVFVDNLSSLYQYLLHTELIGKLGPLEWIFNTPSHHRVHHATNKQYIDKNFGGIFILFDRLFGTFAKEEEKPIYGLTKDMPGTHLWKIAFQEFIAVFRDVSHSRSWQTKFKILFSQPSKRSDLIEKNSTSFPTPKDTKE